MRVRKQNIRVGTWVWYYHPRRWTGRSPKWTRNYVGPMLVTRVLSPTNVCIQKGRRSNPQVVHVDKLKPYRGVPSESWLGDEHESSDDDESMEDPGLPARLGVTRPTQPTDEFLQNRQAAENRQPSRELVTSMGETLHLGRRRMRAVRPIRSAETVCGNPSIRGHIGTAIRRQARPTGAGSP